MVDETFKSTNKKLFLLKLPLAGRLRISWNKEKKGSSIRGRLSVESADFVPKMNPPMTAAQLNRSAGVIDTNDMITPEIKDFILKDLSRRIQMADTKRYRPLMAGTRTVRVPFQNCLGVLALRPLVESVLKDRFHIDPNAALSQPATYSDTDLHLSQPAK
ncbi:MAG: hypothetical protein HY074_04900 [Deltaproteobacteria bacterium]|nr:hypothetical protein [Deltaproteobacteria bacterium]